MVAVGRKQLALGLGVGLGFESSDAAHDQPTVAAVTARARERGVGHFGDVGVGDPPAGLLVEDGVGQRIGVQADWGMAAIAAAIEEFMATVTEK